MSDINELKDDVQEIGDPNAIPAQMAPPAPIPQPGEYEFRLPDGLPAKYTTPPWNKINAMVKNQPAERVSLAFDSDWPLIISWPNGDYIGQRLDVRVSNLERNRARKGQPEILASDLFFLLRDGLGATLKGAMRNSDWIALVAEHSGRFFGNYLELTARCDPERDIYNAQGVQVAGQKGCGSRYYNADIPRIDGIWQTQFTCGGVREERDFAQGGVLVQKPCGARLRAFPQFGKFRLAKYSQKQG